MTYEFHGWLRLAEDPFEPDSGAIESDVAWLRGELSSFDWFNRTFTLERFNGSYLLVLGGLNNRDRGFHEKLSSILGQAGERMPGSYGLVHWRSSDGTADEFRRLIMRRGVLRDEADDLFSPADPLIEDWD